MDSADTEHPADTYDRPLEDVKQRLAAGDKPGAARDLIAALRAEPRNVSAWLLLATLLDDPWKQADCYRRILHLDPQHRQAARQLQILQETLRSYAASESERSASDTVASEAESLVYAEPAGEYGEFGDQIEPSRYDFEEEDAQTLSPEAHQALVEYVVEALGGHVKPRNLIFEVCHRSGMSWQDAEKFVAEVGVAHRHRIARSKSPLSLFLGIGTILAGMVVVYAGGAALNASWQYLSTLNDFSFMRSIMRNYPYYLRGFVIIFVGLSMMLGGTAGVVATVRSLKRGDETNL